MWTSYLKRKARRKLLLKRLRSMPQSYIKQFEALNNDTGNMKPLGDNFTNHGLIN